MTEGPRKRPGTPPVTPGQLLDRRAIRRARSSVTALPDLLPEGSVSMLAREVISRLADRGERRADAHLLSVNLADALTASDEHEGMRLVQDALKQGVPVEDLYLTNLAGAARILGQRWADGSLTASQVTIAAARIYAIMRGLSSHLTPASWPDGRHAIFATVPGEQHTLGVTMAAELFRHEGWLIDLKVGRQHNELLSELAETDFSIIGLSATGETVMPELIRLIAAIRVTYPHVRIVVGGHLGEMEPRLRELTDADHVSAKLDTLRMVMRDLHDTIAAQPGAARG